LDESSILALMEARISAL
jgi:hypothetical protein